LACGTADATPGSVVSEEREREKGRRRENVCVCMVCVYMMGRKEG